MSKRRVGVGREGGGGWYLCGLHVTLPEEGGCVLRRDEQEERSRRREHQSRRRRCGDKRDERVRRIGNPSKFCFYTRAKGSRADATQPGNRAKADSGV
jgi:hypothetical protein